MAQRVFNRMKRQVFRRRISGTEMGSGLIVLALLASAVLWVAGQRSAHDPAERDISFAILESQSVEDRLYKRPLKPWSEPGSATGTAPRLGPFPPEVVGGPWRVATRLQEYTPDNLYVKINGAAEQYIRFGCRRLHYLDLRHENGDEIGIELYDHETFANGLGIFGAQRDPARTLQQEGGLHFYPTSVGAIGVMGRWFFKIAGSAESETIRQKTRQLVTALTALPTGEALPPYGYQVLNEGLGLPLGEIAFQPRNAFQYDFAREFWFGRTEPGGDERVFLHRAADGNAAAELYEALLTEQLYDFQVVDENESTTLLHHRFLDNYFAMVLEGGLVYGVENAATVSAAKAAVERLRNAIGDGEEELTRRAGARPGETP